MLSLQTGRNFSAVKPNAIKFKAQEPSKQMTEKEIHAFTQKAAERMVLADRKLDKILSELEKTNKEYAEAKKEYDEACQQWEKAKVLIEKQVFKSIDKICKEDKICKDRESKCDFFC